MIMKKYHKMINVIDQFSTKRKMKIFDILFYLQLLSLFIIFSLCYEFLPYNLFSSNMYHTRIYFVHFGFFVLFLIGIWFILDGAWFSTSSWNVFSFFTCSDTTWAANATTTFSELS